jgi:hypothetical protein
VLQVCRVRALCLSTEGFDEPCRPSQNHGARAGFKFSSQVAGAGSQVSGGTDRGCDRDEGMMWHVSEVLILSRPRGGTNLGVIILMRV